MGNSRGRRRHPHLSRLPTASAWPTTRTACPSSARSPSRTSAGTRSPNRGSPSLPTADPDLRAAHRRAGARRDGAARNPGHGARSRLPAETDGGRRARARHRGFRNGRSARLHRRPPPSAAGLAPGRRAQRSRARRCPRAPRRWGRRRRPPRTRRPSSEPQGASPASTAKAMAAAPAPGTSVRVDRPRPSAVDALRLDAFRRLDLRRRGVAHEGARRGTRHRRSRSRIVAGDDVGREARAGLEAPSPELVPARANKAAFLSSTISAGTAAATRPKVVARRIGHAEARRRVAIIAGVRPRARGATRPRRPRRYAWPARGRGSRSRG